jgi:hypothetical protein
MIKILLVLSLSLSTTTKSTMKNILLKRSQSYLFSNLNAIQSINEKNKYFCGCSQINYKKDHISKDNKHHEHNRTYENKFSQCQQL